MRISLRFANCFFDRIDDSRGQILPLALAALAVGTLLVSPFLLDASTNLLASRKVDVSIRDYYSADAGIEWALWHLKGNAELTASTEYTEAPLQPAPEAINGSDFPTTEIKRVEGGIPKSITPNWQDGLHCYDFTTTESGLAFGVVDAPDATSVWMAFLAASDPCERPADLHSMPGASPYRIQSAVLPPGSYKLLVDTALSSLAGPDVVTINYPLAAYDIRSVRNGRTITSRAAVGVDTVEVISWQLE
jgi:hypothetical protein